MPRRIPCFCPVKVSHLCCQTGQHSTDVQESFHHYHAHYNRHIFISTVIHIKKMSHCKEKLEQLVSHRLTLMPFHKLLHKSHDTLKAGWKCSKTTHNHECIALSFIFEQLLVTSVKCACKPFVHLFDKLLSRKKIFFFNTALYISLALSTRLCASSTRNT